ncbi:MAG: alkaline phosphatase D family protein, partial [Rubrobacteraceae bacterium]
MLSHRDRRISRGKFINLGGMGAAALLLGCSRTEPERDVERSISFSDYPFSLGVASGDPRPDGVALWTRLAPAPLDHGGGMPDREVAARWEVAEDEGFRKVVRRGEEVASPSLAHSVHAEVEGLRPGRWYFFRFKAGGETSAVGRTRTAPERGVPEMNFAFASCQKWDEGFYSAYRRMSGDDLDLVFHLGDYIYEYGVGESGGARGAPVPEQFRGEATTLDDYRLRYALYKTDADLQAAHAAFPWVVTWDDHDVDNDYAGDDSENSDPRERFLARRAAAYQAFYEHMPLRRSAMPEGPDMPLYRRITYG